MRCASANANGFIQQPKQQPALVPLAYQLHPTYLVSTRVSNQAGVDEEHLWWSYLLRLWDRPAALQSCSSPALAGQASVARTRTVRTVTVAGTYALGSVMTSDGACCSASYCRSRERRRSLRTHRTQSHISLQHTDTDELSFHIRTLLVVYGSHGMPGEDLCYNGGAKLFLTCPVLLKRLLYW